MGICHIINLVGVWELIFHTVTTAIAVLIQASYIPWFGLYRAVGAGPAGPAAA